MIKEMKWIPIDWPNIPDDKWVLVCWTNTCVENMIDIARYVLGQWELKDGHKLHKVYEFVSHWMELPEPPED